MEDISEFTYHHVRISPEKQSPAHSQPTWEISLVLKGSGYRIIGDTRERFHQGDLVLVPPGINHCWYFDHVDVDPQGNIENITLMYESGVLKALMLAMPSVKPLIDRLLALDTSLTFTGNARGELTRRLVDMEQIRFPMNLPVFIELILLVANNLDSASTVGRHTGLTLVEQRIKQIETFVACNFSDKISLDDVALHIGMNKSSMCCMFKRATGRTIVEYITDKRLEHAKYLLSTRSDSETIASICYKVGFQSISHFNHLFKRRFGHSPKQLI